MNYKYLTVFLLLCLTMNGQITNLGKLSKGRFYSSDVIKDDNNNIKGYFLLFESDKIAKETVELEYVILDENLTKVTNGFITEMKYESWLVDADRIDVRASLYKNNLLLELADEAKGTRFLNRYRVLDIVKNEISKPFIFNKDSLRVDPVFSRKNSELSNSQSEPISFYDGVGMVVDSRTLDKKKGFTKKYLAHYDKDFKAIWKFEYSDVADKNFKFLSYLKSDEDVLAMFNHSANKISYLPEVSVLFIDSKTGTLRNEFEFPALNTYSYKPVNCTIKGDKIYLMGNYSKKSKNGGIDDTEGVGLFSYVFDKSSGKLLTTDYLTWEKLAGKLPIDKKGRVKKEGYMYTHDMLRKSDGNIIVVAETFIQTPITTNNMYFFELNDKMEVKELFEVAKFKNKFSSTSAHSSDIKRYGLFDFIDYQDLGDDEYLFFLNDNEKNSKNRKKSTLYGIVSYAGGKFNRQTLDLKTETSSIRAYNSKKGYLMLIENFDEKSKPTEFRLEKINY